LAAIDNNNIVLYHDRAILLTNVRHSVSLCFICFDCMMQLITSCHEWTAR